MSKDGKPANLDVTALPKLPDGWCWATLESVAEIEGGITKDQNRPRLPTMREVPYLRVANVQRGFLDLTEMKTILADEEEIRSLRLQKGDILFTEGGDRDKLGRGWVWNGEIDECIHQNHIFRARPCFDVVDPKFISFHGNYFGQKWFIKTGKQTTNLASINKGVLRRFPVPIAPRNEQSRIVAKVEELLSDLDAGVATLERLKAKLKRYRGAVLKAAVEGRLTAEWRVKHPAKETAVQLLQRILDERRRKWEEDQLAAYGKAGKTPPANWHQKYKEPVEPNVKDLPGLPHGWCWVTLECIARIEGGITKDQKRPRSSTMREVPYLRVANVQRGFLDLAEIKTILAEEEDIRALRLQVGDILFTEGGDRDKLGRGWVWSGQIAECIHQNHVFRARLFSRQIEPQFISYHGNFFGQRWFVRTGKQTTNLASINKAVLSRFPTPIAPPEEQKQIVSEVERLFSIVREVEVEFDAALRRAARLRQSILKRAFEGRLVPQDPHDESASALLKRTLAQSTSGKAEPQQPKPSRSPRTRRRP